MNLIDKSQCDFISALAPSRRNWCIVAKVVRLWFVPDKRNDPIPYSMEMIVMDEKGDKIQVTIRKSLICKFQEEFKEGSVYKIMYFGFAANSGKFKATKHGYKLSLHYGTKCFMVDAGYVPLSPYSFISFAEINPNYDTEYLVDVIGYLTQHGTEKQCYLWNGTPSKMNTIEVNSYGYTMECALYGEYVDELNAYLASSDAEENPVLIIQLAKLHEYRGKVNLKNVSFSTKLVFNPSCVEAENFRKKMFASNDSPPKTLSSNSATETDPEVEFLDNITTKAIVELKDIKEEITCVVLGTIKHVSETEKWWYTACHCNTSVYPDSKMYYCKECDKHIMNATPRYKIKVRVVDDSDSADFVIFDHDASLLLNKSCADMIKLAEKNFDPSSIPKEILNLVDKTFLFKVDIKNQLSSIFKQSYVVRKLCTDEGIIQKFKDKFFLTEELSGNMSGGLNESQADYDDVDLDLNLCRNCLYSTPATIEMENQADCDYADIGTSGNVDKGSHRIGKQLFFWEDLRDKVSDAGDESHSVHLGLGLDCFDPGYLKTPNKEADVTLTPNMMGLSQNNHAVYVDKSQASSDYARTKKRSSEVDVESHMKSTSRILKNKNVKIGKYE